MRLKYKPRGVCSSLVDIEMDNGIIKHVHVENGCDGNLQAVSALLKDKKAEDIIPLLSGIRCGRKNTSCPAQIAKALEMMINSETESDSSLT